MQNLAISGSGTTALTVGIADDTGYISRTQDFTLDANSWVDKMGAVAFVATLPVSGETAQNDIDVATDAGYFTLKP
jgi:hypothetical protein